MSEYEYKIIREVGISESDYKILKKFHDERVRSEQARTNITAEQKNECNCIVNKVWDAGKSFVSGLFWIIIVIILIGLIFG